MSHPIADTLSKAMGALRADDDMKAVLDQLGQLTDKHIEDLDAAAARREPTPADAVKALLQSRGQSSAPEALVPGITSQDSSISGPGGNLPVRIYTPAGAGPFPLVVYFHGGGWVIADKSVYDGGARGLAKEANAVDPLRSDGAQMEGALRKARVPVERRNYDGVTHEFFGMAAVVEKAREAQSWAGDRLLEAFAGA